MDYSTYNNDDIVNKYLIVLSDTQSPLYTIDTASFIFKKFEKWISGIIYL